MSKVILLANKDVGVEVAKYLASHKETEVVALFLTGLDKELDSKIISFSMIDHSRVFCGERLHDNLSVIETLPRCDFIITVFWPYLLKDYFIKLAKKGTVNFHPALLPMNRGWYPHVFNILNNTRAGVTLHSIDSGIDTGPIWAQKEVDIYPTDTADALYYRLQQEIVSLFLDKWDDISRQKIKLLKQDKGLGCYNSISDVSAFDEINLEHNYKGKDLINILRARTFGDKGYSFFHDEFGNKIFLKISLSRDDDQLENLKFNS